MLQWPKQLPWALASAGGCRLLPLALALPSQDGLVVLGVAPPGCFSSRGWRGRQGVWTKVVLIMPRNSCRNGRGSCRGLGGVFWSPGDRPLRRSSLKMRCY